MAAVFAAIPDAAVLAAAYDAARPARATMPAAASLWPSSAPGHRYSGATHTPSASPPSGRAPARPTPPSSASSSFSVRTTNPAMPPPATRAQTVDLHPRPIHHAAPPIELPWAPSPPPTMLTAEPDEAGDMLLGLASTSSSSPTPNAPGTPSSGPPPRRQPPRAALARASTCHVVPAHGLRTAATGNPDPPDGALSPEAPASAANDARARSPSGYPLPSPSPTDAAGVGSAPGPGASGRAAIGTRFTPRPSPPGRSNTASADSLVHALGAVSLAPPSPGGLGRATSMRLPPRRAPSSAGAPAPVGGSPSTASLSGYTGLVAEPDQVPELGAPTPSPPPPRAPRQTVRLSDSLRPAASGPSQPLTPYPSPQPPPARTPHHAATVSPGIGPGGQGGFSGLTPAPPPPPAAPAVAPSRAARLGMRLTTSHLPTGGRGIVSAYPSGPSHSLVPDPNRDDGPYGPIGKSQYLPPSHTAAPPPSSSPHMGERNAGFTEAPHTSTPSAASSTQAAYQPFPYGFGQASYDQSYLQSASWVPPRAAAGWPHFPSTQGADASLHAGSSPAPPVAAPTVTATPNVPASSTDRFLAPQPPGTRYFVIKSFTEDDIAKSLTHRIWASTEKGNLRLDRAFRDIKYPATSAAAAATAGTKSSDETNEAAEYTEWHGPPIWLFFSVNASGHFCGVAEMRSPVDHSTSATVWAQEGKWKGTFAVEWAVVKDVPNATFRHLRLTNTAEHKPVTQSRDTQELPAQAGQSMLRLFAEYRAKTSLLQDVEYYELQQRQADALRTGNQNQNSLAGASPATAPLPQAPLSASTTPGQNPATAAAAAAAFPSPAPPYSVPPEYAAALAAAQAQLQAAQAHALAQAAQAQAQAQGYPPYPADGGAGPGLPPGVPGLPGLHQGMQGMQGVQGMQGMPPSLFPPPFALPPAPTPAVLPAAGMAHSPAPAVQEPRAPRAPQRGYAAAAQR